MVTKNQIKLISGLQLKKNRIAQNLFFAEGQKTIEELILAGLEMVNLYVSENIFVNIKSSIRTEITFDELKKISALTNANNCLAIFKIPQPKKIKSSGIIIALDSIRDPGNLGTIIRLCDWFGIADLICSDTTVDVYNPKVVQATMGSIARVNINYLDLENFLQQTKLPIYGAFMDGDNIYKTQLPDQAIIVMGNEANGISDNITKIVQKRVSIPKFGSLQEAESLNVSAATAIVMSEFKRG